MKTLNLGIVGATGVVGETFLRLLNERKIKIDELRLFASPKSAGKKINFQNKEIALQILADNCFDGLDVVFFSSGDDISKEWAPKAAASGAYAIDNSAAYRMDESIPLVVPEVNFDHIKNADHPQIIANPNCSTIQLVMALNALKPLGMKDIRVSSYQAVSGAGKDAINELKIKSQDVLDGKISTPGEIFQQPIAYDCIPIIGSVDENGFCSEENKIVRETKKILSLPNVKISAFTVRIPTLNSHAEAVWVTFEKPTSTEEIQKCFRSAEGVQFISSNEDFHSLQQANEQDDSLVSRLRKCRDQENTWMFWVVADNIRRGAASNGLFIAEKLFN